MFWSGVVLVYTAVLKDHFLRNDFNHRNMEHRSVCLQSVVCTPTDLGHYHHCYSLRNYVMLLADRV